MLTLETVLRILVYVLALLTGFQGGRVYERGASSK